MVNQTFDNITTLITDLGPVLLAFTVIVVPIITLTVYFALGDFVTGLFDSIMSKVKGRV